MLLINDEIKPKELKNVGYISWLYLTKISDNDRCPVPVSLGFTVSFSLQGLLAGYKKWYFVFYNKCYTSYTIG